MANDAPEQATAAPAGAPAVVKEDLPDVEGAPAAGADADNNPHGGKGGGGLRARAGVKIESDIFIEGVAAAAAPVQQQAQQAAIPLPAAGGAAAALEAAAATGAAAAVVGVANLGRAPDMPVAARPRGVGLVASAVIEFMHRSIARLVRPRPTDGVSAPNILPAGVRPDAESEPEPFFFLIWTAVVCTIHAVSLVAILGLGPDDGVIKVVCCLQGLLSFAGSWALRGLGEEGSPVLDGPAKRFIKAQKSLFQLAVAVGFIAYVLSYVHPLIENRLPASCSVYGLRMVGAIGLAVGLFRTSIHIGITAAATLSLGMIAAAALEMDAVFEALLLVVFPTIAEVRLLLDRNGGSTRNFLAYSMAVHLLTCFVRGYSGFTKLGYVMLAPLMWNALALSSWPVEFVSLAPDVYWRFGGSLTGALILFAGFPGQGKSSLNEAIRAIYDIIIGLPFRSASDNHGAGSHTSILATNAAAAQALEAVVGFIDSGGLFRDQPRTMALLNRIVDELCRLLDGHVAIGANCVDHPTDWWNRFIRLLREGAMIHKPKHNRQMTGVFFVHKLVNATTLAQRQKQLLELRLLLQVHQEMENRGRNIVIGLTGLDLVKQQDHVDEIRSLMITNRKRPIAVFIDGRVPDANDTVAIERLEYAWWTALMTISDRDTSASTSDLKAFFIATVEPALNQYMISPNGRADPNLIERKVADAGEQKVADPIPASAAAAAAVAAAAAARASVPVVGSHEHKVDGDAERPAMAVRGAKSNALFGWMLKAVIAGVVCMAAWNRYVFLDAQFNRANGAPNGTSP